MRIVIAGGSGFLGRALAAGLAAEGHEVVVLSRRGSAIPGAARGVAWAPDGTATGGWSREIDGAGAVVNLAGEGIADRRWSAQRKAAIRESRVRATRSVVAAIRDAQTRPPVLVQGSAIGYYGTDGDERLDESASPGSDFLADVCVRWEAEAHPVAALGCRLAVIRTGIVLARDGGALKELMRPFRFFVGGPMASGRQYMSWIHRDDWVRLVSWAIATTSASGVYNATAPEPVPNATFSRALGRAMHRPSLLPVPAFALRVIVGEFAQSGLIEGQRVVPRRALDAGFQFKFPDLDSALRAAV
jgi:uncharacterized protein (TIGR01777 family)